MVANPRVKMNLYLHIGTEKTGSSFLQKVCAINRDWLAKSGVYFPEAGKDEKRLRTGSISPGNARALAKLIGDDDWSAVNGWLKERLAKTRYVSCQNLLLSHELLFACLAKDGAVEGLAASKNRLCIDQIFVLLMVRDPVDHAISLYKHRGKNGRVGTIGDWINSNYATAVELDNFVRKANPDHLSLDVRKYQKRTDRLLAVFFLEWLGLPQPPLRPEVLVNPSLTLSEIELLKKLAEKRPADVRHFYEKLLSIPHQYKDANEQVEHCARRTAGDFLAQFNSTWRLLDKLLEKDGGLNIPKRCLSGPEVATAFSYSDVQLRAIAEAHQEARGIRYRSMQSFDNILRQPLVKLKKALGL